MVLSAFSLNVQCCSVASHGDTILMLVDHFLRHKIRKKRFGGIVLRWREKLRVFNLLWSYWYCSSILTDCQLSNNSLGIGNKFTICFIIMATTIRSFLKLKEKAYLITKKCAVTVFPILFFLACTGHIGDNGAPVMFVFLDNFFTTSRVATQSENMVDSNGNTNINQIRTTTTTQRQQRRGSLGVGVEAKKKKKKKITTTTTTTTPDMDRSPWHMSEFPMEVRVKNVLTLTDRVKTSTCSDCMNFRQFINVHSKAYFFAKI